MVLNNWIEENIDELKKIVLKVSKEDNPDLFQLCIEQLLKNKKSESLTHKERLYFFVKIVKNNFYSNSSQYFYSYTKYNFQELNQYDVADTEPDTFDELDWVFEQIKEDKKTNRWYYARLMEIFIEEGGSIIKTTKRTTIPRNSVSRDINKYRTILNRRRKLRDS